MVIRKGSVYWVDFSPAKGSEPMDYKIFKLAYKLLNLHNELSALNSMNRLLELI